MAHTGRRAITHTHLQTPTHTQTIASDSQRNAVQRIIGYSRSESLQFMKILCTLYTYILLYGHAEGRRAYICDMLHAGNENLFFGCTHLLPSEFALLFLLISESISKCYLFFKVHLSSEMEYNMYNCVFITV